MQAGADVARRCFAFTHARILNPGLCKARSTWVASSAELLNSHLHQVERDGIEE
jgi:hypothetical protein